MDLLCVPDDPSAPTEKCPYVSTELWDGTPFRLHLHRRGLESLLPPSLRVIPGVPAPAEAYRGNLYPTPKEEIEPLLQTWLFFGLIAEFFGLNELEGGERLVDRDTAVQEIAKLHKDCLEEENGEKYLSGKIVLDSSQLFVERLRLALDVPMRLEYLRDCLYFGVVFIHSLQVEIDHRIRTAIVALGELLTTGLYVAASQSAPAMDRGKLGMNWFRDFVKVGSEVEAHMVQHGWCPSEIEKIRSQFQGVFTMYYISRLQKPKLRRDHRGCSVHACRAFQMDMATYKPIHAREGCPCSNLDIEEDSIIHILNSTDSYPVLRVEHSTSNPEHFQLIPEPWEPGVPYVALSHVWADGLGNPRHNSLPRCRLQSLIGLVKAIQADANQGANEDSPPYRLWVDTLCCPIQIAAKMVALQRIANVYRQAKHVLVLDSSLTEFISEESHPADLLLRVFGSSPWVRRLWTLQEGILAQSLYFQFADRAVDGVELLKQLFAKGQQDTRYMRIWQDVINEFSQLQSWDSQFSLGKSSDGATPPIIQLQRALHFRTVSVASDEPLCIATLMNLDQKYIGSTEDGQERMARVWELLAKAGGGLPVRMIFFLEKSLELPGWRWAPLSLLSSATEDPVMGIDERVVRFENVVVPEGDTFSGLGIPTRLGLKVQLYGRRIMTKPRVEGMALHPWPDMINSVEDQIMIRDETGGWLRIIDWYRTRKLAIWTREERSAYDAGANNPLCRAFDTGNCALIYDVPSSAIGETWTGLVVQVAELNAADRTDPALGLPGTGTPLHARRERSVIVSRPGELESELMDAMQLLADRVATDQLTRDLHSISDRTTPEWKTASDKVRDMMKEATAQTLKGSPRLELALRESYGEGVEDFLWVCIPKLFSHDLVAVEVPGDQIWIVD